MDYFVAGVQDLAGQHGYALHPVRACLFSGYGRVRRKTFRIRPLSQTDGFIFDAGVTPGRGLGREWVFGLGPLDPPPKELGCSRAESGPAKGQVVNFSPGIWLFLGGFSVSGWVGAPPPHPPPLSVI